MPVPLKQLACCFTWRKPATHPGYPVIPLISQATASAPLMWHTLRRTLAILHSPELQPCILQSHMHSVVTLDMHAEHDDDGP